MLSLTPLVPGSSPGPEEHRDSFEVYWFAAADAPPASLAPASWLRLVAPDRLPLAPPAGCAW